MQPKILPILPKAPDLATKVEVPRLIIGEGSHDAFFLRALLRHCGLGDIQTGHYGGKDNLRRALAVLRTQTEVALEALGITADADDVAADSFQRVCDALEGKGYTPPSRLGEFSDGKPRVGVFLMPDNVSPGMMETLCLQSVDSDPAVVCVDQYFKCVAQNTRREPAANKRDKARAHAWLASQPKPDKHCGLAAEEGYWDFDSPALEPLRKFVMALDQL